MRRHRIWLGFLLTLVPLTACDSEPVACRPFTSSALYAHQQWLGDDMPVTTPGTSNLSNPVPIPDRHRNLSCMGVL